MMRVGEWGRGPMALDSYMYGRDPLDILEERQEREQRQGKSRARKRAESLFRSDEDMGRKLEIPGHVAAAMHQWGEWASRPNFWADLRITPFCKLIGMASSGKEPNIRLDPQSQHIHRAVMRIQCEKTKAVLYAYYVMGLVWYDRQTTFSRVGIGRDTFYRLLRQGSISAFNSSGVAKQD